MHLYHPGMRWNIMSESRLFHLLLFTSSHFHFLIIVEFATPVRWINLELWAMGFTKSLSLPMWHSRSSLMSQITYNYISNSALCRSQWPCGLLHRSAAARLQRLWVQIPLGAWMSVCCECFVLSGRGFCDKLNTHPEESYQLWYVIECDLETSWMRRPWPTEGCLTENNNSSAH